MKAIDLLTLAVGMVGLALFVTPVTKGATTEIANVTGCLANGARAHQYSVTDAHGTTYGLLPGAGIDMKRHVGQQVAITGWVIKAKKEQREARDSGTSADDRYLRVNQVKKLSASCP